jgi:hypothetical protein
LSPYRRKRRIVDLPGLARQRRGKTLLRKSLAGVTSQDGHGYGHNQAADVQNCSSGKVQWSLTSSR